jgi:hypothetical protein
VELDASIENLDHKTSLLPKAIESQYEKDGDSYNGKLGHKTYYSARDENGNKEKEDFAIEKKIGT